MRSLYATEVMASGQANAPVLSDGTVPTLTCLHEAPIAAMMVQPEVADVCGTIADGAHNGGGLNGQDAYTGRIFPVVAHAVHATSMSVRRLTPVECERLQGFPDNYTRIPWKRKLAEECADGGRYKALGNSMAVNCMRWIGQRIELVEKA